MRLSSITIYTSSEHQPAYPGPLVDRTGESALLPRPSRPIAPHRAVLSARMVHLGTGWAPVAASLPCALPLAFSLALSDVSCALLGCPVLVLAVAGCRVLFRALAGRPVRVGVSRLKESRVELAVMEGEQAVNPAPEVAAEEPQVSPRWAFTTSGTTCHCAPLPCLLVLHWPASHVVAATPTLQPGQASAAAAAEEHPAGEAQLDEPTAEEQPAADGQAVGQPAADESAEPAAAEPAADEQPANGEPAPAADAEADGDQKQEAGTGEGAGGEGSKRPPAAPASAAVVPDERRPSRPPQIFFNGAPPGVKRDEVEEVFGTYGKVGAGRLCGWASPGVHVLDARGPTLAAAAPAER